MSPCHPPAGLSDCVNSGDWHGTGARQAHKWNVSIWEMWELVCDLHSVCNPKHYYALWLCGCACEWSQTSRFSFCLFVCLSCWSSEFKTTEVTEIISSLHIKIKAKSDFGGTNLKESMVCYAERRKSNHTGRKQHKCEQHERRVCVKGNTFSLFGIILLRNLCKSLHHGLRSCSAQHVWTLAYHMRTRKVPIRMNFKWLGEKLIELHMFYISDVRWALVEYFRGFKILQFIFFVLLPDVCRIDKVVKFSHYFPQTTFMNEWITHVTCKPCFHIVSHNTKEESLMFFY